jgi:hypothetical protein
MKILKPYIIELAKTLQSHWYHCWRMQPDGSKGEYLGVFPSSTTILNAYPQSAHLTRWIAEQGWNEAQAIKSAAGERGTTIHKGIEFLLDGGELCEGEYMPGHNRPVSLEEYWKLFTFVSWHNEYQPKIIVKELKIFSEQGQYAGTLDALVRIGGEITIIDWKSGSSIHEHFPLQFASYAKAIEENTDIEVVQTACLQLGAQNKNGYRFVVYPDWRDHYKVFEHVRATWQYDYFDAKKNPKEPPVLDLPATLKLERTFKVEALENNN